MSNAPSAPSPAIVPSEQPWQSFESRPACGHGLEYRDPLTGETLQGKYSALGGPGVYPWLREETSNALPERFTEWRYLPEA